MLWLKKYQILPYLDLVKIRVEKMLNNVLEKKETVSYYIKKNFQSLKNRIFPKGLTHALGHKCQIFLYLDFVKTRLEIILNNFGEKKETFFYKRTKIFDGPKNCIFLKGLTHAFGKKIFCKGVNPWVWSKIGHFSIFF